MDGAVNNEDVLLGGLTPKNEETRNQDSPTEAKQAKSEKNSSCASSNRKRGRPRVLNKGDNAAEVSLYIASQFEKAI